MISIKHFAIYCKVVLSKSVVHRALKVSLIVGSALNLINQGEVLLHFNIAGLHLGKFLLTYIIPYGVTSYTATAMKLEFQIGTKAVIDADLECKKCGYETHVKESELIPECPTCGLNTHWKLK